MKKFTAIITAVALVSIASPMETFARGHGSARYSLCSTENCNIIGTHKHGYSYYTGHYLDDGHEYHEVCLVQYCNRTTTHIHDGNTYFGHHNEDGHTYHNKHRNGGRHH